MDWVRTCERNPEIDGEYITASTWGRVSTTNYTKLGGWNTHIDLNGHLCAEYALSDDHILAWMEFPEYPHDLKKQADEEGDEEW